MATDRVIRILSYLHRIVEAGERGYAVAASNINNQGLKILLRSFAQQRARFKSEILAEIQRLGGDIQPRSSLRGILHRGRIDIFAALTIGNLEREKVVLNEVLIGEKVAVRTYTEALKKELPPEVRELIERQSQDVARVVEQVKLIRGVQGRRLVVQLFDAEPDAEAAIQELQNTEVGPDAIQKMMLNENIELYTGKGTTVFETSISGAVGGALWGNILGAIAGVGAQQSANIVSGTSLSASVWSLIALAGVAVGALIGAVLGFFIGMGISEDDSYLYNQSLVNGKILVLALVNDLQTTKISQMMTKIYVDNKSSVQKLAA